MPRLSEWRRGALRLRSTAGKIRLQFLDSEVALRESLIREQIERISQRIPEYKPEYKDSIADANAAAPPDDLKTDWLERWIFDLERKFREASARIPMNFRSASSMRQSLPIRCWRSARACKGSSSYRYAAERWPRRSAEAPGRRSDARRCRDHRCKQWRAKPFGWVASPSR